VYKNFDPEVLTCHARANTLSVMTTTPERTATLTSLVAAEVRAWMGRLDVRQSELARRMGESDQWLSMRLKGRTPIDVNELHRIAKALGLGVHQLLPAPEVAARAADVQAIAHYLAPTVRTIEQPTRPRDNRPSGHPFPSPTTGVRRTAHLPRTTRPKVS
jgi:transcriptional regulator with XRE-family HTH domain